MTIFKKLKQQIVARYQKFQDNRLIASLLDNVSPADLPFVKPLLQNQLNSLNCTILAEGNATAATLARKKLLMLTSKRLIKKLLKLKGIVAIQPMQGPVGLVYLLQFSGEGNTLRLEVCKLTTEALSRKFQARLTIEAMQDLQSMFRLDIEQEISNILAHECAEEYGMEVVGDLVKLAKDTIDVELKEMTVFSNVSRLMLGINQASSRIAQYTRRGAGNFIIVSPITAAALSMGGTAFTFVADADPDGLMSLRRVGDVMFGNGKAYTVYESLSPSLSSDEKETILVGYKGGSGECDTGYVLSPYVPILSNGVCVDPETFQPVMPLMTRYGKKTMKADSNGTFAYDSRNYYHAVTYNHGDLTPTIE